MSEPTLNNMTARPTDENAPPAGTAIVRPLRHIRAVRERQDQQRAERSQAGPSRTARAWSWALGETNISPVTDRMTEVPPSRADIEAEIAAADERRLRGDRENRTDGAATVLRWLIGEDDRIPVPGENPGELVGGFGDIVRSRGQIAQVLAAAQGQSQATASSGEPGHGVEGQLSARRDTLYVDGVVATLAWGARRARVDSGHRHVLRPDHGQGTEGGAASRPGRHRSRQVPVAGRSDAITFVR